MKELLKEVAKAFAVAAATACGTAFVDALLKAPPAATTASPKPKRSSVKRRHGSKRGR